MDSLETCYCNGASLYDCIPFSRGDSYSIMYEPPPLLGVFSTSVSVRVLIVGFVSMPSVTSLPA